MIRPRHYVIAGAALAAIFTAVSLLRFIDGDEGFYLVAARLVREGKRPYADFFYLQLPLLPYVFAGWLSIVGPGWYAARVLAAILATALGLGVFHHVARITKSAFRAYGAAFLYAASGLSLGWFSAVKTYGLSGVLLFGAYLAAHSRRRGALVLCGLCLGLATCTRLYLVVAVPCVVLYLWRERALGPAIWKLALGLALGLLPCLPFLIRDREAFLFDTFTFHSLRFPEGGESLFGDVGQKWETLFGVLGLYHPEGPFGIQTLLLVAACVLRRGPRNSLARYLWIVLGAVSLLPNPTFLQYFCLLIPFLAVDFAERPDSHRWVLALGAIVYLTLGVLDVRRFVQTGTRVPGIEEPANAVHWSIPTVVEVGQAVDRAGADVGGSLWPGYFAFTRTGIVVEMANDFAVRAAPKLSPEQRARFHIFGQDSLLRMLQAGQPKVFVEGNGSPEVLGRVLAQFGYRVSEAVHDAKVWVHPATR